MAYNKVIFADKVILFTNHLTIFIPNRNAYEIVLDFLKIYHYAALAAPRMWRNFGILSFYKSLLIMSLTYIIL